jgi:uncharacterized protein with HEPN domain
MCEINTDSILAFVSPSQGKERTVIGVEDHGLSVVELVLYTLSTTIIPKNMDRFSYLSREVTSVNSNQKSVTNEAVARRYYVQGGFNVRIRMAQHQHTVGVRWSENTGLRQSLIPEFALDQNIVHQLTTLSQLVFCMLLTVSCNAFLHHV